MFYMIIFLLIVTDLLSVYDNYSARVLNLRMA